MNTTFINPCLSVSTSQRRRKTYSMNPTQLESDLITFKNQYKKISNLNLPFEYLRNSDVYVFKNENEIIGGFVLGKRTPLRTVNVFVSEDNQTSLKHLFDKDQYCEVCCFWILHKYRKSPYLAAKFWLMMANEVRKQEKELVIYGTNTKGLAKLYNYPIKSILFHKDKINSKNTYVFVAHRKNFFIGTLKIVMSKLLRKNRSKELLINNNLKKRLVYELMQY